MPSLHFKHPRNQFRVISVLHKFHKTKTIISDNMRLTPFESEEADEGRKIIADTGGTRFAHITLYNSLWSTGDTVEGIDALCTIYSNLLALHGFMAGFQFIAIEAGVSMDGSDAENMIELAVFSCRYFGFSLSLGGSLICLIIQEYLKCIQNERIDMQVRGICKYALFFQMGDYTAIGATVCLALSSNFILWSGGFPVPLAVAFNVYFGLCGTILLYTFFNVIVYRQDGRNLYNDENFKAAKKRM